MKLDLALRELHRSEKSLGRDLLAVSDRHREDHEIHHVAYDLACWSNDHVKELAEAGQRYELRLDTGIEYRSNPLKAIQTVVSELGAVRSDSGLLLLADLRRLHRKAAGVSVDWELLTQGAQAAQDTALLELAQRCHPHTLRQLKWTNAMLKTLSPQVLTT
jgi:hypothetical protein